MSPTGLADAQAGAQGGDADVLILADPQRLPDDALVARLLWWQHECDYAVSIATADQAGEDDWLTRYQRDSEYLDRAGFEAWRGAAAGTLAVPRRMFAAAGGMGSVPGPGWQVELAYRLAQQGAVFVADDRATEHRPAAIDAAADVQELIPLLPERRPDWRRTHAVPAVHVLLDCASAPEAAALTLEGILDGEYRDVAVSVLGSATDLVDAADPRVTHVDRAPGTSAPIPFRLEIPAGCVLQPFSIRRMLNRMRESQLGLYQALVEPRTEGAEHSFAVRLLRTAAMERSRLLTGDDDLDDTIDELFGSTWVDGRRFGIRHHADAADVADSPEDDDESDVDEDSDDDDD